MEQMAGYAEVFYVVMGHTDFLRVDEQGQEEWVRCGPGDTLAAPMNALHAFHNRTDKPSRFIISSVYYHEVLFETYAPTVDVNDPVPPKKEPTEAEGEQYLQLLKDAMKVHMYAPQANASDNETRTPERQSASKWGAASSFEIGPLVYPPHPGDRP